MAMATAEVQDKSAAHEHPGGHCSTILAKILMHCKGLFEWAFDIPRARPCNFCCQSPPLLMPSNRLDAHAVSAIEQALTSRLCRRGVLPCNPDSGPVTGYWPLMPHLANNSILLLQLDFPVVQRL